MLIYDVVIIGGGVVGASIARELSRYRLKVALLEKEEELSFGVSKSNSGIIHPGTQMARHLLKSRLCVQGNRLIRKIALELGVDFKEVGELIVAFNEGERERLFQLKKDAEALGVRRLRIVDKTWLKAHEPGLNPAAVAALYAPSAGIVSPYRLVYALAENAKKNGVEIYTQKKVENIGVSKIFDILATGMRLKARYVVNAAGLFADDVANMVGINDFTIKPRKGEEYLLDKKKQGMAKHLIFPLPSKISKGILIIRTSDGNPMIGPTAVDVEDKTDYSTTDDGLKMVLEGAQKLMPSINKSDIISYFAGLRPVALRQSSGLPMVAGEDFIIRHEDKIPGFINVAGIQSPGLTAAPAIAVMVAEILKKNGLRLKKKIVFHKYRRKSIHLFDTLFLKMKRLIKKDSSYGDIVCRCEMVSAKEIEDAVVRGASTLDGVKFRTRAQAGRCHGSFCTTRIMKILAERKNVELKDITKRGKGSEIVASDRGKDL